VDNCRGTQQSNWLGSKLATICDLRFADNFNRFCFASFAT